MANTQSQFGFLPYGIMSGRSPTFGYRRRLIAWNYATALFKGDPVASDANGNIVAVSSQVAPIAGIFWGCEYPSSQAKSLPIKSPYWPGSTSGAPTNAIVVAWIIDDREEQFKVASLGGSRALARSDIGNNVQWVAGAGGNTATGASTYCIDDAHVTTTATLPFKIVDLYSTTAPPGDNGSDDTTIYNWAVVQMNNADRGAGQVGI